MKRPLLAFSIMAAGALPGLACGALGDPNAKPALATIHGELTNQAAVQVPESSAGVRVAIVWGGIAPGSYSIAEDLPVQPVFPSQFRIVLTSPPPDQVMVTKASMKENAHFADSQGSWNDWPDDFGYAIGSVVAYEDLNANGKLDLVEEGASAYVDQILGANESLILLYVEGTIPADTPTDAEGHRPTLGYNLVHQPHCVTGELYADGDGGPPQKCTDRVAWLPIDTLYSLPLTADPKWAQLMCKGAGGLSEGAGAQTASGGGGPGATPSTSQQPPTTPPSGPSGPAVPTDAGAHEAAADAAVPPDPWLPAPNDPKLHCSPDGRAFSYCDPPPPPPPVKLCGPQEPATAFCGMQPMPNPPPPNWPCPVH